MTPQISNFSPNLALECQDPYPNNLLDISTQMSNWCFKQHGQSRTFDPSTSTFKPSSSVSSNFVNIITVHPVSHIKNLLISDFSFFATASSNPSASAIHSTAPNTLNLFCLIFSAITPIQFTIIYYLDKWNNKFLTGHPISIPLA